MQKNNIPKTAIILAGGKGTRLSEQTKLIPKPLVKVGDDSAIFHIIRHFVSFGVTNIIIPGGYKFDVLVKAFQEKFQIENESDDNVQIISRRDDLLFKAHIKLIDTGYTTGTAQRINKALKEVPDSEENVFVTYGDTFSDVNLRKVSDILNKEKYAAVLTVVPNEERFGIVTLSGKTLVNDFSEKVADSNEFINGGYIGLNIKRYQEFIDLNDDDFSRSTLPRISESHKLGAYVHKGFWFAMDSQRDYEKINKIYNEKPELFERGTI